MMSSTLTTTICCVLMTCVLSYLKSKVQRILPILTPGSIWSGILCERENILLVKHQVPGYIPEPICKKTESVYDSAHDCGNTLPDPQALIKNLMSRCVSSPLNTWPVFGSYEQNISIVQAFLSICYTRSLWTRFSIFHTSWNDASS